MAEQIPPTSPPGDNGPKPPQSTLWQRLLLPVLFLIIVLSMLMRSGEQSPTTDVAYSEFKVLVANNQVAEVVWRGDLVTAMLEPLADF